jgi:hypothetical protein
MAKLPLDQAVNRFLGNDERMEKFANGSESETYTTSGGVLVPSIRRFLSLIGLASPGPIGNVTPGTGAFTTLNSNGATTLGATSAVSINSTPIGSITPSTGVFTTLSASGALTTAGLKEDASGNLGLGVVPSAWGGSGLLCLPAGSAVAFQGPAGSIVTNAYYNSGWKYAVAGAATWVNQTAGGYQWHTAPSGTAGNPITFTQAMTLDASGNLLVGATTLAYSNANNVMIQPGAGALIQQHASGTPSGNAYTVFNYNGSAIGSITQSGTTAVVYATTSDHRLKENVRPANATRFGDIEFVDFEWTDGRHDCGVIAHQLQSVYPDLVLGEKDATEVRTVEITPAVPAVTEQVLVTPAVDAVAEVLAEDGNVTQEAVAAVEAAYETVEVTPAVPAVTEDQTFPVYQQVNYMGLIGRMGTTIQKQQSLIEAMEARLSALEAA